MKHLNRNGFIVVHDCNPITEFRQREQYEVNGKFPEWNGTVWKSWVKLRCNNPMLKMYVVDIDTGCGVITSGSQMLWDGVSVSACLEYSYLAENRKKLLNLISVDEFIGDFIDG